MNLKKVVFYALYKIAYYLPKTKNSYTGLFERIRAVCVRGFVDHCGKCCNIQPHATIARRVSIGDYSGVGKSCLIQSGVTIGNHVMMGPEVFIYTQNHNISQIDVLMDNQGFDEEEPVVVEDNVWIGARVTILPGVRIGTGTIIGASAVVSKDIPAYSVAVGNPARVVKNRRGKLEEGL